MVLAGGIVFATASELGSGALDGRRAAAELMTDWLGFPLVNSSARRMPPRRPHRPRPAHRRPAGRLASLAEGSDHPLEEAEQRQGDDAHGDRAKTEDGAALEDPRRGRSAAGREHPAIEPTRRSRTVEPAGRSRRRATRPSDPTPSDPPRRPHTQRPAADPTPATRPPTPHPATRRADPTPSDPPRRPHTQRPARRPHTQRPAAATPHPATRRTDPTPSDPPPEPEPTP